MKITSKIMTVAALAVMLVGALALTACGTADKVEPVYVPTKIVSQFNAADETLTSTTTNEYDEHGNIIKTNYKTTSADGTILGDTTLEYTRDENGAMTAQKTTNGDSSEGEEITYEVTTNDKGLVTKSVSSNGSTLEYTYDSEGLIATMTLESGLNNLLSNTQTFENGRLMKVEYPKDNTMKPMNYEYVLDGDKIEKTIVHQDGEADIVYTYDYDENGNAITVYQDGEKSAEVEYQKIEKPCAFAAALAASMTL